LSNRKNENAIHHVDYSEHRHDRLQEAAAQVRPTRQLGTEGGLHADSGRDGDDPYIRLASVSGKSRELLFFLYKKTLNSRERCITDELSVYDLSDGFSAGESSPKQTHDNLRTLKENQVIFLQESKRGRGGWSRYRINRHIFEQIITMERPLHVQNARATRPVLEAAHATANPSLSSKEAFEADSAWRSISIDEARAFAFSETHLWQLYDGQIHENEKSSGRLPLTAEQVQNSIDAWVHARKSGKSDAGITVFMGVVRNRKEWLPVEGFRSRKTIEAEVRAKVAAEEVEALRRAEEAERQLAFLKWKNGLSTEVQRQLVEKHCSWGKPNPGTRIWEEALMREYEGGVGEDVRAEV
jgi:hypothetical protein